MKHIVGFVDFILNKQATQLHFFHSYVLPKFNSVYTRVLHFYPGLELKNYTSVIRGSVYTRSYTVKIQVIVKRYNLHVI